MSNYLGNQRVCYMQPRIPYEYQEVEYIESTGTEYIDLEIVPDINTKVICKFQLTATGANYPFGCRQTSQANICYVSGGASVWNFRFGASSSLSYGTTDTEVHIIDMSKNGIYFDNIEIATPNQSAFTCPGNMYVFALNNNGSVGKGKTKIFTLEYYDNNALVRDLIPCYRKLDGAGGLYDLVNRKFYENKGTGDFKKGANSTKIIKFENRVHLKLPYDYQEIEYIQTTGTQYIDTDYYATPNTKICAVFKFNNDTVESSSIVKGFFGVQSDFTINFGGEVNQKDQLFIWLNKYNNNSANITTVQPSGGVNKKLYYEIDAGSQTYIIGDKTGLINTKKTTKSTISFPILGQYREDYGKQPFDYFSAYLYSFQIFDKDTNDKMVMVKNFIPCYRKNDGEIGLFDTVNRVFYTNSGTGVFLKGGDVK